MKRKEKFKKVYIIVAVEHGKEMQQFVEDAPLFTIEQAMKHDPSQWPEHNLLKVRGEIAIYHNTPTGRWVVDCKWDWDKRKWIKVGIKTSSAKAKGRALQQWFAEKVGEVLGLEFGKDKDIESRPMGQSGPDLRLSEKALKLFPYTVECKAGKSPGLWAAIKQAEANRIEHTHWLVVLKRDRALPIVTMQADIFLELLKRGMTT